ncbi:MAG: vWA domain-containing protein [Oligoflexus sp.]
MTLAYPWVLLALLILPFMLWYERRRLQQRSVRFSTLMLVKNASVGQKNWQQHLPLICRMLSLFFLIVAVARPQSGESKVNRNAEGLDIVLVIDTSGSMKAMDFEIGGERRDRLFVVKEVIDDFIQKRHDDRLSLVVFGTQAFTQAPLTRDHEALLKFLHQIEIGMAGESTAIGDAIAVAVKRLQDIEAKSKVVILMTDGESNAGSVEPLQATEAAKALGIKIYTIGVGSNEPVPFPVETWYRTVFERRIFKLDEKLLQDIAKNTGGQYFLASDTEELQQIYETVNQLETRRVEYQEFFEFNDIGQWFIAAALVFMFCDLLVSNSRWRRIP